MQFIRIENSYIKIIVVSVPTLGELLVTVKTGQNVRAIVKKQGWVIHSVECIKVEENTETYKVRTKPVN